MFTLDQVAAHNKPTDCWVIIANRVYDVTDFLKEHPGGASIILKYAGKDATQAYAPIHPSDALEKNLPPEKHLGPLTESAARHMAEQQSREKSKDEMRVEKALLHRPPLSRILNLADMEVVARQVLSHKAEAYYSSAADDHITTSENARAFSRFYFHPRVMRPVAKCDPSTSILGFKSSIPVFVSGAALAKLGHPLGEINITRGAARTSIIQMVSSNASMSFSEIMGAASPTQPLFFQLYKHSNTAIAEERVREVERLGYKAIFLTVDAVVAGNREKDIRSPWALEDLERGSPKVHIDGEDGLEDSGLGTAGALIANDDREMTWEKTIPWLRSITKLPIVVKGVQCVQDAVLAVEAGVDGILLSNHGGRQLEYSLPPIEVLYRLRKQRPDVFEKTEVYIDGGIQRGTDVLKALCLGATAVGLGRPFLYAQSAYGEDGVVKIVQILQREIVSGMHGLGASRIRDLIPDMATPVVPWNQNNPREKSQDRWSKTYVSKDRESSPTRQSQAPPPSQEPSSPRSTTSSSPTKRFPRPLSQSSAPSQLSNRVSAHITSSTSSQTNRPPSPLKYSSLAAPESGILPSPHDATLSKVYGSVLQPRETLPVQACANCNTPFVAPTTSTIYPDPYGATTPGPPRFFCRSCFISNGGSRGPCAECSRPVLILKSEGGFVHAGDKYWHKKCFNCIGCDKSIGDSPMLDLLGRPTCHECFDTCLERDATTPKKTHSATSTPGRVDRHQSREGSPALEELEQRLGIIKNREPSPALEELSYRLSMIGKDSPTRSPLATSGSRYSVSSRETSPLVVRSRTKSDPSLSFDNSPARRYERFRSPEPDDRSPSPSKRYSTSGAASPLRDSPNTRPAEEAIEEMKRRFMKSSSNSPAASTSSTPPLAKPRLRSSRSSGRLSTPSTPDLTSDSSDATSSVGPDSPPRSEYSDVFSTSKVHPHSYSNRPSHLLGSEDIIAEETSSQMTTPVHTPKSSVKETTTHAKSPIPFSTSLTSKSPKTPSKSPGPTTPTKNTSKSPKRLSIASVSESTTCVKCLQSLFSVGEGGRYVTVPNELSGEPESYHSKCFTCVMCSLPFKEGSAGQALFVKGVDGPAHVECAPPQKISIKSRPTTALPGVSIFASKAAPTRPTESNKFERPPMTAPPTSTPMTFPRFGGSNSCPGCNVSVSPMERGVVPGPQGSRWHASCLVCGGKKPPTKSWAFRDEKKKGVPGCGKKLDSAAKRDVEGRVWCRECSLLLPMEIRASPQSSPTRTPIVPTYTGSGKIVPQTTGTTTIARQITGHGNDPSIFRQLTGVEETQR
ncbi:hypothetical protein MIND_00496800 [Mycena indigotica]|uniref:L-lactate dehydrogenase (cytochrome) n=1 Tax=Mycena indigotica TaxID=2126181 RepID=A0A8H6W6V6_9AGAR|nr:uncharacterized protein MIND_00496800 [Mycena indigotica]KAF7307037.1 hypothetical protein MIND_00496800 [Mycena indigotica]